MCGISQMIFFLLVFLDFLFIRYIIVPDGFHPVIFYFKNDEHVMSSDRIRRSDYDNTRAKGRAGETKASHLCA